MDGVGSVCGAVNEAFLQSTRKRAKVSFQSAQNVFSSVFESFLYVQEESKGLVGRLEAQTKKVESFSLQSSSPRSALS